MLNLQSRYNTVVQRPAKYTLSTNKNVRKKHDVHEEQRKDRTDISAVLSAASIQVRNVHEGSLIPNVLCKCGKKIELAGISQLE